MKKTVLLISCLIAGCSDPVTETGDPFVPITEKEISLIPYKTGDSLQFLHSSGALYRFTADTVFTDTVTRYRTSIAVGERAEVRIARLHCASPYIALEISAAPGPMFRSAVSVNSISFSFPMESEEVQIGGRLCANVYRLQSGISSEGVFYSQILYTAEKGVVQIGKSNGETFTLVQ